MICHISPDLELRALKNTLINIYQLINFLQLKYMLNAELIC